ncbi:thiamine phosphate synthase [Leptolyngbya sp. AN03gr2]|uniref:thiamine phosphate synthase n=1 Tax=unclassified Leptolyngbya TaxID=2650499 RepID=UPI003D3121C8
MGNFQSSMQPALYRILDANLDRAREGLRVIEEWCRFGLEDVAFTEQCKHWRQELAQWHRAELRSARNTPDDPGTELTHPQEAVRSSIEQVLQANFARVEEALRVLEEYGKVYRSEMASAVKQMRYEVYTLESRLLSIQRRQLLESARLYLVTSPSENLFTTVESALQGGLTLVQYRDKETDDLVRLRNAEKLRQLCHEYDALFIVNDRIDLALAVDADGVHLGQDDLPLEWARRVLGEHKIIGRSTHSPEQLESAIAEGADYVGVGPVYETPTKAGRPAAGLDYVRHAAANCSIPWYAIGGIDTQNIHEVLSAGAERVSVVRAIMQSDQPTFATQFFVAQLDQKRRFQSHSVSDPWEG